MNELGAALFGGWILKELALRGVDSKEAQSRNLAYIGPIVALGLLVTSTGITYLGATASTVFPDAGIGVYTVPWLMLVYPAIIVLLVGGLFDFGKFKPAMQGGIVTAVLLSIGDFLAGMGLPGNALSRMTASLPLGAQGLGWLLPSIAVAAVMMVVAGRRK